MLAKAAQIWFAENKRKLLNNLLLWVYRSEALTSHNVIIVLFKDKLQALNMERAFRLAAWQFWANAKWKMAQSWEKQLQMWDVYRLYLCSEFLVFTCKIPMLSDHQEYLLSQVCKYLSLRRWFLGYWTFSTSELFNVVVSKLYFWIFLIFFSQLKLSAHKLDWYLAFITLTQKLMSCLVYFCANWHQAF